VLRAVARLDAHRRDGERRERGEPGQDLRVDRALGGGAQETAAWVGRTVSHVGVLVTTNFLFFFLLLLCILQPYELEDFLVCFLFFLIGFCFATIRVVL